MGHIKTSTKYFRWMCQLIHDERETKGRSYLKLLKKMDSIEFTYSVFTDKNREADGIELRYDFGYEHDISKDIIRNELDIRPCSLLEMLVALCRRCEVHIMDNPEFGDRTGVWFWGIINNMGLMNMDDEHYDPNYTIHCIRNLLNRTFNYDGSNGGLVTLPGCEHDLRDVEFWYHMMWYFSTFV